MKIPVFLSYPKPFHPQQDLFLGRVLSYLENRGLAARTLGVTDYDTDAPLRAIRRMLLECNGLVSIAFRRSLIVSGKSKPGAIGEQFIQNGWLTSPWAQIEAAMAYQLGLPVLLFREKDVIAEGMFEKGVVGIYMPEFDVADADNYFRGNEWSEVMGKWEGYVRSVVEKKGNPPQLY